MAHIDSLGAGIFTYLDIYSGSSTPATENAAGYADLFVTVNATDVDRMPSVREFPSIVLLQTLLTYQFMVKVLLLRCKVSLTHLL